MFEYILGQSFINIVKRIAELPYMEALAKEQERVMGIPKEYLIRPIDQLKK